MDINEVGRAAVQLANENDWARRTAVWEPAYGCSAPCACTPVNQLASRYVHNCLVWDALTRDFETDNHVWTDRDQLAAEDCAEEAQRLQNAFNALSGQRFAELVSMVCIYAAHINDVFREAFGGDASRRDDSQRVSSLRSVGTLSTPNPFIDLAAFGCDPEANRQGLTELWEAAMRQVIAFARVAEGLPSNPFHAALADLDRAHGVNS